MNTVAPEIPGLSNLYLNPQGIHMREYAEVTVVQAIAIAEKFMEGLLIHGPRLASTKKGEQIVTPLVLRVDCMPVPTAEEELAITKLVEEGARLPEPLASIRRGFRIAKAVDWPLLTGWPASTDLRDTRLASEHTAALVIVSPVTGSPGKAELTVMHKDSGTTMTTRETHGPGVGGVEYYHIRGTWHTSTPPKNIAAALGNPWR